MWVAEPGPGLPKTSTGWAWDPANSSSTVAVSVTEPPAGNSGADATSCTRVGAGLACAGTESHPNSEDNAPPPSETGADTAGRRLNRTTSDKHAEIPRNLTGRTLTPALPGTRAEGHPRATMRLHAVRDLLLCRHHQPPRHSAACGRTTKRTRTSVAAPGVSQAGTVKVVTTTTACSSPWADPIMPSRSRSRRCWPSPSQRVGERMADRSSHCVGAYP